METKKSPKANLENKKILFREIGLVVALLLAVMAFEWRTYDKKISFVADVLPVDIDEIVPVTIPELPLPEPIKAPEVTDVITIVDNIIDIPGFIPPTEDIDKWSVKIRDYLPKPVVDDPIVDEVIPATVVEEKAIFMGGDENEFSKWVGRNMVYPEAAIDNRIQGRVICSFVVAKDGNVVDVKILRGADPLLDKEAIRVISMSPKWTPGKQYGKAVRVKYTFPVIFQLK